MKKFPVYQNYLGVLVSRLTLSLITGVLISCSGTTFTTSTSKPVKVAEGSGLNGDGLDSDEDSDDDKLGGKEENSRKLGSRDGTEIETDVSVSSNPESDLGGSGLGLDKECLAKKAGEYNIVILVDTSNSQRTTDPNLLRVKAGTAFIKDLAQYAKLQPGMSIEVGIAGFAGVSTLGAHGALDVGKVGSEDLSADLAALNVTLGPGTNFEAGLNNAVALFTRMGAKKGTVSQRNFVIFLSDGEPNMSTTLQPVQITANPQALKTAILANVNKIVSDFDAAMITIASGTQISPAGIEVINSMALPTVGTPYPEHTGKYIRVDSEAAFETLSKTLGTAISDCTKK